ncbi:MAG: GWxTD domain-containing protein [Gemmatimonadaceae bacterium]|nr:GWxTD domain-containing protein [Gemmatimonadaceae bacterium]
MKNSTVGDPAAGGPPRPGGLPGAPGAGLTGAGEMQRLYRAMGLISGAGTLSFVASASFLTAPSSDTTLVLLALSLPSRSLAFTREGDRYAAEYSVKVEVRRGPTVVSQVDARESVKVPTYRETSRTDESIIWQQYLRLAPGRYSLAIALKDESGLRNASEEVSLEVPRLTAGAIATPIAVYEAIPRTSVDSLPRLLARPRSTVTFGVDSLLPVYLEAVGPQAPPSVTVRVIGDGDQELWVSTVELAQRLEVRSATIAVPVTRLGVGISSLVVTAAGRSDTARTRLLVSLGDDLPIATFDEMLNYLRYFAPADRLKPLREATPVTRSEVWAKFLKDTDPVPGTSEHEGLRDYFARIRTANQRFRDDGPIGWQTDRGTAFVALGDPDNVYDTGLQDPGARVRQQVWEYRALRLQLVFLDQTGFGRWRLGTSQRAELENAIRRKLSLQP